MLRTLCRFKVVRLVGKAVLKSVTNIKSLSVKNKEESSKQASAEMSLLVSVEMLKLF